MDRCTCFPRKTGKRRNLRSGSPCQVKLAENLRAGFLCHHRVSADAGRAARMRRMAREEVCSAGKNTSARTSMLSRGGVPGASGFSNEVWKDNRARPSLALSWIRIRSAWSVRISEKSSISCRPPSLLSDANAGFDGAQPPPSRAEASNLTRR